MTKTTNVTTEQALDAVTNAWAALPVKVGSVADIAAYLATRRGWDGTLDGNTETRVVAGYVSTGSLTNALTALVNADDVTTVPGTDPVLSGRRGYRQNATYYTTPAVYADLTERAQAKQVAHLRADAEQAATADLIAAHTDEYETLVQGHMAAAAPDDEADDVDTATEPDTAPVKAR